MIRTVTHALFVVAGLALAAPAYSAGYLKIGDIKGESTDDRHGTTIDRAPASPQPTAPSRVQGNDTPKPAGLLLPAVQKAQEPAPARGEKGKKKGNVEYQWKIEEGVK
jgi:hypothetical protein